MNKIITPLKLPYLIKKLETTSSLIKVIKRNTFSFQNFYRFKINILIFFISKKEKQVASLHSLTFCYPTYSWQRFISGFYVLFNHIRIVVIKSCVKETIFGMEFTDFLIQQEGLVMRKASLLNQATGLDEEFCNLNKILTWSIKSF